MYLQQRWGALLGAWGVTALLAVGVAAAATVGPFASAEAQQCVGYFEKMLQGMERDGVPHAGTCAKRNKLMLSLTDMVSQEFYAPGSPGARKDIPGKRAGTVAVDPNFASWSKPDFEAYLPPWQDGRWWKDGSKIVFNCQAPIPAGALQQAESFLECARVYSCGAAAALCGLELARTTNTSDCASISRTCLAANPVPSGTVQGVAAAPPPSVPHAGPGTSAPRTPPQQAQMSPQCMQLVQNYVQAAQANDGSRALAGYNSLKAAGGCGVLEKVDRPMPQEAQPAQGDARFAKRGETPLSDSTVGACDLSPAECAARVQQLRQGISPQAQAAVISNAIGIGLQLGTMMGNAMALGVPAGSGGGGGGAGGSGTNMNSIGPGPVRSTYGQGGPTRPGPPASQSTITGIK
jgi:hypothetical protein